MLTTLPSSGPHRVHKDPRVASVSRPGHRLLAESWAAGCQCAQAWSTSRPPTQVVPCPRWAQLEAGVGYGSQAGPDSSPLPRRRFPQRPPDPAPGTPCPGSRGRCRRQHGEGRPAPRLGHSEDRNWERVSGARLGGTRRAGAQTCSPPPPKGFIAPCHLGGPSPLSLISSFPQSGEGPTSTQGCLAEPAGGWGRARLPQFPHLQLGAAVAFSRRWVASPPLPPAAVSSWELRRLPDAPQGPRWARGPHPATWKPASLRNLLLKR